MVDPNDIKRIGGFFKALSHPTRIAIVLELLKEEKCVSNLKDLLQVSQPNISQHLAILKVNDIVDWKQQGKRKCYFLRDYPLLQCIVQKLTQPELSGNPRHNSQNS